MSIDQNKLKNILEAALMAVGKPMSIDHLLKLFNEDAAPTPVQIKDALKELQDDCEGRGIELKEIASGYRYQARQDYSTWLSRLWEERAPKYSRAYLETLALIAYRQPVTRAEIEEVRGVSVSSNIIKTMMEREWIRVVGHRDVPGRPSLYATTKQFLDYFNMKSLDELPSLAEIRDLEELNPELDLSEPGEEENSTLEQQQEDKSPIVSDTAKNEEGEEEIFIDSAETTENTFEEGAFEDESYVDADYENEMADIDESEKTNES